MTDFALPGSIEPARHTGRPNLDKGFNPLTMILFFGVLAAGLLFVAGLASVIPALRIARLNPADTLREE